MPRKKKKKQPPTPTHEQREYRVADLAEQVKAKQAEHKALEAELAELKEAVGAEADELVRYAKERGHRWSRMMARDKERGAHFLAATLLSFGLSAEGESRRELDGLRRELREARRGVGRQP